MTLPASNRAEVKRILDAAARRLLEEQLQADGRLDLRPPTGQPPAIEETEE